MLCSKHFFSTYFLNEIWYLIFVRELVREGAALYIQHISFTANIIFQRSEETKKNTPTYSFEFLKSNNKKSLCTCSFNYWFHEELIFSQNLGSSTSIRWSQRSSIAKASPQLHTYEFQKAASQTLK